MITTLNKIKSYSPCEDGWNKLLNHLKKTQSDDEPLYLRTILESNGLDDTIWAFRAVEGKDKEIRLFAVDCAELVLPIYEKQYPNDDRPRLGIQAARDYTNGLITIEELGAARDASNAARAGSAAAWAGSAARAAAWAASAAVWDAARDASDAASDARAAAGAAAWAGSAADAAWAAWAASDEIKQILSKYI
jgi:hypothetical protein